VRGLTAEHIVNWRNKSWSLTAQVVIPDGGASGVLLNLGGGTGGWSFYLKGGVPAFCYNLLRVEETIVRGSSPVPPGEHQVRMEFADDGGGLGKGGAVTLYVDGQAVGHGRIERTAPIVLSGEATSVGRDSQSPVTGDYDLPGDAAFTGTLKWVEMEGGKDSHDHLLDPADIFNSVMARH